MEGTEQRKRQTAYLVKVNDLLSGTYVKEEGWEPNYINTLDGRKVSRVNIIGVVISRSDDSNYASIVVDDKSESIAVRAFDDSKILEGIDIGQVVVIIGRPREFGKEKYIVPEIVKKVDVKWLELRMKELELIDKQRKIDPPIKAEDIEPVPEKVEAEPTKASEPVKQEVLPKENLEDDPYERLLNLIKSLDQGVGADFEEVIAKSKVEQAEKILTRLLEEGDIFEVTPGKLKVLE